MKLRQMTTLVALLTIGGGIPGCGGGSEGTGAFSSSFAKNTPVSSLSSSDKERLCGEYKSFTDRFLTPKMLCPLFSIIGTLNEKEINPSIDEVGYCSNVYDRCLMEFDTSDTGLLGDCIFTEQELSTCNLPVGVVEECLNTVFDDYLAQIEGISCSQADKIQDIDELEPKLDGALRTPECQRLTKECPEDFRFED